MLSGAFCSARLAAPSSSSSPPQGHQHLPWGTPCSIAARSRSQARRRAAESGCPGGPQDGEDAAAVAGAGGVRGAQRDAEAELYEPGVATWGVFPRPSNISEAYGGGRTITPGQQLETQEQMEMREARTKQLLDHYRKKVGLDVEPALRDECEKVLKQGDNMMDKGKLQAAVTCYDKVMQQMPFQSSLHGHATLQLSLCLDSMGRYEEARCLNEKISNHPDITVRKNAKQLLLGFQAMQELNFSRSYEFDITAYRKYFDAFADGYSTTYKASQDEPFREWVLLYIIICGMLLAFPVILVSLFVALRHK